MLVIGGDEVEGDRRLEEPTKNIIVRVRVSSYTFVGNRVPFQVSSVPLCHFHEVPKLRDLQLSSSTTLPSCCWLHIHSAISWLKGVLSCRPHSQFSSRFFPLAIFPEGRFSL